MVATFDVAHTCIAFKILDFWGLFTVYSLVFMAREARMFNEKLKTGSPAFNLFSQTTRLLITQSNSR